MRNKPYLLGDFKMLKLSNLFGHSPFESLMIHMEKVAACVEKLRDLFEAVEQKDPKEIEKIALQVSQLEHAADLAKNDIRNHLPKSLFLPIDRTDLLEILTLQDALADCTEDVGVLLCLRPVTLLPELKEDFKEFLDKNLQAFHLVYKIIEELKNLLHTSFGGAEAEKVRDMVNQVAFHEHEVDLIQRKLLKNLFSLSSQLEYSEFYIWTRLFEGVGSISNLSEKLANRVRRTLELK
jgi:uncharacterized protein